MHPLHHTVQNDPELTKLAKEIATHAQIQERNTVNLDYLLLYHMAKARHTEPIHMSKEEVRQFCEYYVNSDKQ